jgi:4-alpha-glucanotransferase
MSWMEIVDRLASVAGLEPWYYDIAGVKHETTIESKVLLLSALGFDVSSIAAARSSLKWLEEEPWRRRLASFTVTRAKSPRVDLFLPADLGQRVHRWRLEVEGGGAAEGDFRPDALPLLGAREVDGRRIEHRRLPLSLPSVAPGYHRITISGDDAADALLALVPDTSYLPRSLAAGQRLWGVAAHLYTLRSHGDWGIGDFSDLARLGTSTGRAGGSAIALNPFHALFPGRPEDASPYSPSSRLFLNPLYIDIEAEASARKSTEIHALTKSASRLRASDLVDYTSEWRAKQAGLETLFARFKQQPEPPEFADFVIEQGEALGNFALFSALAERHGLPWQNWPLDLRRPDTAARVLDSGTKDRGTFHRFVQFVADRQLRKAADDARGAGMDVGLIRDLAMGIHPDGADAWMNQDAYVSGLRCGAPPDDFQPKGQEWGVLPLDPVRLRRNLEPFVQLLRANMRHAGGLRIDHVIGLQRQFLVPLGAEAKTGCYVRFPLDDLLGILALESWRNRCLVIGEDLGTVPEGFRQRIHDMDIPGCAVLYFERTHDGRFKPPSDYRKKSVATVSTHDLTPFAGFWEKRDIAQRQSLGIYTEAEAKNAEVQRDIDRARLLEALTQAAIAADVENNGPSEATEALCRAVHAFLASSSAQLFLAKLDDLLGEREQLNVPGTTFEAPNWRRKLSANLGDPVLVEALDELSRICATYGRKRPY